LMIIAELIAFLVAGLPFLQDNISLHIGRVGVPADRKGHLTRKIGNFI
jgi:hypothetical protein